nr:hypothetical protein [Tanacetum cinerariifolium]
RLRRLRNEVRSTMWILVSSELKPTPDTDFKNLHLSDFEDLNFLLLQVHLDHLPGSDKRMLSTAVKLWTRNLVIRQQIEDFQLDFRSTGLQSQGIQDQAAQSGYEYMILDSKGRDKEQRVHSNY